MKINLLFFCWMNLFVAISCGQEKAAPAPCQKVQFEGHSYDVCKIDLREQELVLYSKDKAGNPYKTLTSVAAVEKEKGHEILLVTNGGIYDKDLTTTGLYVENGTLIKPVNKQEGKGNFYLKPNGVFLLSKDKKAKIMDAQVYDQAIENPYQALQSGPMLVLNDNIHPVFRKESSNTHIRNGIGVINEHEIVIAISNEKVNLWHFANLFKENYGCANALYLDGFVSKMYCPSLGREEKNGGFASMIAVY